jgi:hypothetical protein
MSTNCGVASAWLLSSSSHTPSIDMVATHPQAVIEQNCALDAFWMRLGKVVHPRNAQNSFHGASHPRFKFHRSALRIEGSPRSVTPDDANDVARCCLNFGDSDQSSDCSDSACASNNTRAICVTLDRKSLKNVLRPNKIYLRKFISNEDFFRFGAPHGGR